MGLEREQGERHDLTSVHDEKKLSKYEDAKRGAGLSESTAHRWQTMAWAAACSEKLAEDDPARAAKISNDFRPYGIDYEGLTAPLDLDDNFCPPWAEVKSMAARSTRT